MTDAEYEQTRDKIEDIVTPWLHYGGLGAWQINRDYIRDSGEFFVDDERVPTTAACAKVDWRYMHATLSFNVPKMAENPDEIEYIVVHELMHVFLHEMREDGIDHEERVATMLARAHLWMREERGQLSS